MNKLAITVLISLAVAAPAFAGGGEGHNHKDAVEHGKDHEDHGGHASALGKPGDPGKASRTVEIKMNDSMRFVPSRVTAKKGEMIRFVVKNDGKLKHEMVLGTIKELKEHAAMMQKMPEMEHADPNMVSVDSGKTGELVWQFTKAGTFDFACLQPGHYEAGMKGKVAVADVLSAPRSNAAEDTSRMEMKAPMPDAAMTDGEVKKIDKDAGKITLKHGPIANLQMPGMTMVFRVADPEMLDRVRQGDNVRFRVEKANGALTITTIEVAR